MARHVPSGTRLVIATHNRGKLREIEELLAPLGIDVVSAAELGLDEPTEDAPDFAGNARIKALAAAKGSGLPALSDDSGFCVAALGGAPGVLSARWAEPGRDFAGAMARVEAGLAGQSDRRACFVCALCLGWPDKHTETFLGRVDGTVCWPPRGDRGFGYDPIFVPARGGRSFGEMESGEKHAISHRARAFAQLVAACFG
ncbi:MAG: RdgB/HAM1 family non-canonical purine NTP pyrophosphatase [Acetobacteraceae bacterium]|nr:RdgB/HAM1 family non-canonical purine NTP pyrophosphatase [Acetobacteraceae bacterium]MBV8577569.1 RdgB/HAM1 family non-canonical purine NTP pyrophosphatase [Acetobacteraceae bacterium]